MSNRICVAPLLALTASLTTACAGFEPGDELGFDDNVGIGDEDRDGEGAGGEGHGQRPGRDHDGCSGDLDRPGHDDGSDDPDSRDPNAPGDGACEPHVSELIAGQHFDTGSVTLNNTNDSLELAVVADAPYLIVEAHAYLGSDPVPLTNGGAAAPGQFPYQVSFDEPAAAWQLSIPFAELAVGCGDQLEVAVHATVVSIVDGVEVFEETAWALGTDEFETSWGWTFDYGICCEPTREQPDDSCTLTQGYWKTHHSDAEQPALQQPWPIAEDTMLCDASWLDILHTQPEGDAWLILAHQTIAAQLNVASGASTTAEVDAALVDAEAMLGGCALTDAEAALAVASLLDAYNNGEVGPGHCG